MLYWLNSPDLGEYYALLACECQAQTVGIWDVREGNLGLKEHFTVAVLRRGRTNAGMPIFLF